MSLHDALLAKAFGGSGGGNANIDVTASVGQTIRVKAVDENGKPTEWEAVEYQKKICGEEMAYVIPETTVNYETGENTDPIAIDSLFVEGKTYVVNWEGVDYACECFVATIDGATMHLVGNRIAVDGNDTGEPFIILTMVADGVNIGSVFPVDETLTTFAFSVKEEVIVKIPAEYIPQLPYCIEVTGSGTDDDPYVCNNKGSELRNAYNQGRLLIAKKTTTADDGITSVFHQLYQSNLLNGNALAFMFVAYYGASVNSRLTVIVDGNDLLGVTNLD